MTVEMKKQCRVTAQCLAAQSYAVSNATAQRAAAQVESARLAASAVGAGLGDESRLTVMLCVTSRLYYLSLQFRVSIFHHWVFLLKWLEMDVEIRSGICFPAQGAYQM